VSPAASSVDTIAMGNPVALDASAELRDVRGLISITTTRPVSGWWASWTFVPPTTPIARTMRYAMSCRVAWRPGSMVSIGAVQNESPVWTPTASTFSMKHTVISWSLASRTTSSSSSSQPRIDSSTRIWPIGDACRPRNAIVRNSSTSWTKPPPVPPIV